MRRTAAGVIGIFLAGGSAAVYSIDRILFSTNASPYSDLGIFFGLSLFLFGAWRGGVVIGFDLEKSWETLRSKQNVLSFLDDAVQSSAYIEALVNESQTLNSQNGLNVSEKYLKFAAEIWAESLSRKGLTLIENILENGDLGDLVANKNYMSSM
ncbi:MAG: hypothetical protein QFX35_00400 [Candidatus Verstraetearchaeota archaeon]|nr:hypothetical protein [Candidatus Verstraetearchaeota archaeon]